MSPISNETMVVVIIDKVGIDVRPLTFHMLAAIQPKAVCVIHLANMPPAWDSTVASE